MIAHTGLNQETWDQNYIKLLLILTQTLIYAEKQ